MTSLSFVASSIAGEVGDLSATRTVYAIIVLLIVLGVALTMVAVWAYRSTRPDEELLAPLELMQQRSWRRADPVQQRRQLDEVRPDGAEPLEPSAAPPDLDEAFDDGPAGFNEDDLDDLGERHGDDELESAPEAGERWHGTLPAPRPDEEPVADLEPPLPAPTADEQY